MSRRLVVLLLFAVVLAALAPVHAQQKDARPPVVEGTLVGHDGTALSTSHMHVHPHGNDRTRSVRVGPKRSFRTSLDTTGVVTLRFTGRNHKLQETTIFARPGDTIGVDVRLGTFAQSDSLEPSVFGTFNDFSTQEGTVPMTKRADGTYAATVPSPGDSLTYGVLGASPDGTQIDRLTYAGRGNYRPVVAAPADSIELTYDPSAVPRSDADPSVRFRDTTATAAQYAAFVEDVGVLHEAYVDALRAAETQEERRALSDTFDWAPNRKRLTRALENEPPAELANAYRAAYLDHTFDADSTVAKELLATLSASSPMWGMEDGGLFRSAVYTAGTLSAYESFAYQVLRETPSDRVRASTLMMLLQEAAEADEPDKQELLYAWMEAEHADSRYTRFARSRFAPDRAIQKGNSVPEFEVRALRDTSKTFTPASFEGQYVLLDFWATWCAPCIEELPTLRAADSTYGGDDFAILSLSFDEERSTVTDFLQEREMPWQHAFVEDGFNSEVADQFEVVGIPKPILVGPDGQIVATEGDLRGEDLLETVEEHLGPTADGTGAEAETGQSN